VSRNKNPKIRGWLKVIFWGSCVIFLASPRLVFSLACSSTAASSPLPMLPQAVVCTNRRQRPVTILPRCCCRMDHVFQREGNATKWHQNNGVARVDGVLRDTQFLSRPRFGGSRGYNIPLCQMMVDSYQAGNPAPEGRTCQEMGRQAEEAWVGGEDSEGKGE
jgi:hypothetical protein